MHSRREIVELLQSAITEEVIILPTITSNYLLTLELNYDFETEDILVIFGYLIYKAIQIMDHYNDKYLLPWDIIRAARSEHFDSLFPITRKLEIEVENQFILVSMDYFVALAYWLSFFKIRITLIGKEFDIQTYLQSTHCRYLDDTGKSYCFEYQNPKAEKVTFYSNSWDYYEGLAKAVEISSSNFPDLNKTKLKINYGE